MSPIGSILSHPPLHPQSPEKQNCIERAKTTTKGDWGRRQVLPFYPPNKIYTLFSVNHRSQGDMPLINLYTIPCDGLTETTWATCAGAEEECHLGAPMSKKSFQWLRPSHILTLAPQSSGYSNAEGARRQAQGTSETKELKTKWKQKNQFSWTEPGQAKNKGSEDKARNNRPARLISVVRKS